MIEQLAHTQSSGVSTLPVTASHFPVRWPPIGGSVKYADALRLHSRLGLVTIVNLGSGLTPSARFTAKRVVSYALPKRFRIHSMVDRRSGS